MNREEFLGQLEGLLSGISEEERADAMAYYRSYFEDAGEGNEAAIMEELESPRKVADSILKNLEEEGTVINRNSMPYQNSPYGRAEGSSSQGMPYGGAQTGANGQGMPYGGGYMQQDLARENNKKNNTAAVVIWTVVAVLTSPIWLTLLLVAVAIIFAIAVSVIAVMAALVITGVVLFGVGIGRLFTGGMVTGLGLLGGGLMVLALGILAVVLMVWVFGVFLPWAVRGIAHLCKKPFEKRKEQETV